MQTCTQHGHYHRRTAPRPRRSGTLPGR